VTVTCDDGYEAVGESSGEAWYRACPLAVECRGCMPGDVLGLPFRKQFLLEQLVHVHLVHQNGARATAHVHLCARATPMSLHVTLQCWQGMRCAGPTASW
jgi:hypothetical protein